MPTYGLYTLFLFVSLIHNQVVGEITLRLNGTAFYGQPLSLICFDSLENVTHYAVFLRSSSSENLGTRAAAVWYSNSTCRTDASSFTNYTYSCYDNEKEIALTIPAENEVEHNTFWRCGNRGGPVYANNNILQLFVYVRITSVSLTKDGHTVNDTILTVTSGKALTLSCVASASRPEASYLWYIGSELRGAGRQLTFTPMPEDHGQSMYCLAYNIDLETSLSSQRPILKIKGIPDDPTYFSIIYRTVNSVVFTWKPSYGDGYSQSFVIEGKYHASDNWTNMSTVTEMDGRYAAVVENLVPGEIYMFRIYAFTSVGRGNFADTLNTTLQENDAQVKVSDTREVIHAKTEVSPVVGAGIGGVVFGIAATILILFLRRKFLTRKANSPRKGSNTKNEDTYYNIAVTELDSEVKEIAPRVSPLSTRLQDQENYSQLSRSSKNENEYDKVQCNA